MADDKHEHKTADEHKATAKPAEDLTPTPTQAEMDAIMAKLTGAEVPKKREAKTAEEIPTPTMTQAENDAAMAAAHPGEPPLDELNPLKRDAKQKEEEKRKKELEAEQSSGYQTRTATPVKK